MTLIEVYEQAQSLDPADRKTLVKMLVDSLDSSPRRKLSELRGLGAHIWQGVDAQAYLDEMRDEWELPRQ